MPLTTDWSFSSGIAALYLGDATHPPELVGTLPMDVPMQTIFAQVEEIHVVLGGVDTIAEAMPRLAETDLQGERLWPYRLAMLIA